MPAGSERPEIPRLPTRFRPRGVRVAAIAFGAVLVVTVLAVWLAMPASTREGFSFLQNATVLTMVLGTLAVGHALARCRVDADDEGLTVVNGYRTHRLAWQQVVSVTLRPGSPWAVLDLSDGTTRSAMGIQGSDGRLAVLQTRQLKALVAAHAATEPRAD